MRPPTGSIPSPRDAAQDAVERSTTVHPFLAQIGEVRFDSRTAAEIPIALKIMPTVPSSVRAHVNETTAYFPEKHPTYVSQRTISFKT
jgi:hypothetical protein